MVRITLILSLLFLLASCSTTNPAQFTHNDTSKDGYTRVDNRNQATSVNEIDDIDFSQPLEMHLSKIPGVRVTGQGPSATVRIRGMATSIIASNDPLFVLDGQPLSGDFSDLYAMVNTADIDRISVLKDAEASIYGVRGANGVILIKTKQ